MSEITDEQVKAAAEALSLGERKAREVLEGWVELEYDPSEIDLLESSYRGEFSSMADFAEHLAWTLGRVDEPMDWPFNCIDWEAAADELKYEYKATLSADPGSTGFHVFQEV